MKTKYTVWIRESGFGMPNQEYAKNVDKEMAEAILKCVSKRVTAWIKES